jgi:hypothetical protein
VSTPSCVLIVAVTSSVASFKPSRSEDKCPPSAMASERRAIARSTFRAALAEILRAARRREGGEQTIDNRLNHLRPKALVQLPDHALVEHGNRELDRVAAFGGPTLVIAPSTASEDVVAIGRETSRPTQGSRPNTFMIAAMAPVLTSARTRTCGRSKTVGLSRMDATMRRLKSRCL